MNKNIKLRIKNYSNYLTDDQLISCLELLPIKYKCLTNKVFIFKSFYHYIFYCIKHFQIISAYNEILTLILSKINDTPLTAHYGYLKRNIYLFEDFFIEMINLQLNNIANCNNYTLYKSAIDALDLDEYRRGWISFVLVDTLIHELTHAIQHKEKRLTSSFKTISKPWEDIPHELDAVKSSIEIMNINYDNFIKILDTKGISINHSLAPLEIRYKYKITIH